MYVKFSKSLARVYDFFNKKKIVSSSEELKKACKYLNVSSKDSQNSVKATLVLSFFFFTISIFLILLLYFSGRLNFIYLAILLSFPILVNHFFSNHYKEIYYEQRIIDMSVLPDFFTMLISYLKINSNLEKAILLISRFDFKRTTRELKKVLKDIDNGKEWDIKKRFIQILREYNNPYILTASNSLLSSLTIKNKVKREHVLKNSLDYLLKGIINENKEFNRKIYTPILMLFGFGTILPLIVISIFPMLSILNNSSFSVYSLVMFLVVSLIIIKLIISELKKKSPSRFSQIEIKKEVKGINSFLLILIFFSISTPSILYFLSYFFSFEFNFLIGYRTLFFYIALNVVIFFYLYFKTKPLLRYKKKAKVLENELLDDFYILSSRINEGHSTEDSIKYLSNIVLQKESKDFFIKVYNKIVNLGWDLKDAFYSIRNEEVVFSNRVKSLIDLFIFSVRKHSIVASENIIEICNYYSEMKTVEENMYNELSKNMDMIKLTYLIFAPLICAIIIGIQGLINEVLSVNSVNLFNSSFTAMNIESVIFVISSYLFFLTVLLANFYSFIESNSEKISKRKNLMNGVIISGIVFTVTLIVSKLLFFNI